jgi:hypothetical protein
VGVVGVGVGCLSIGEEKYTGAVGVGVVVGKP